MTSVAEQDHATDGAAPSGWLTATRKQMISTDFGKLVVRVGGNELKPTMSSAIVGAR